LGRIIKAKEEKSRRCPGIFALSEVDDDFKVFTTLEALFFKASRMGFNRTIVGWKPKKCSPAGTSFVGFNRTIVGWKQCKQASLKKINPGKNGVF